MESILCTGTVLCTIGLPSVDESMTALIGAMSGIPQFMDSTAGMAKIVGSCIALGVGANEAYMMMLGKRGIDVMKILRIVIISLCIAFSSSITGGLSSITSQIEDGARQQAIEKSNEVALQERVLAELKAQYLNRLRAIQDSARQAERAVEIGDDPSTLESIAYSVTHMGEYIGDKLKEFALAAETKISEWVNDIIRFIGQILFQCTLFGLLLAQKCFLAILGCFCPLLFALSLAPPWRSAWSQWMAKYITVGLWGWVAYTCLYYVDFIFMYCIKHDQEVYMQLGANSATWEQIGTLGMEGVGSACLYVVACLMGVKLFSFVPEVASWLIPGGVSSGAGSMAAGAVTGGAAAATGAAPGVANGVASFAGSEASMAGQFVSEGLSKAHLGESAMKRTADSILK